MKTIRGEGKLYSGDREIADIAYTIYDTTTGRPFEGDISGAFRLSDPYIHPIHRPNLETPFPVIHLDDGRTLDIIIERAPMHGDQGFHFQGTGDFNELS